MRTHFAWLEITGKCQLACRHCYADSGPWSAHGRMRTPDWERVIDQLAAARVACVQFIGGEPMLYPDLASLVERARSHGLGVEVFSNLVHVPGAMWTVLQKPGVSLATSYYSDNPVEHDDITSRPSHARTRANIKKAVEHGVQVRAGVIDVRPGQRSQAAASELATLGVGDVSIDRLRGVGRGAGGHQPGVSALCGQCAHGVIAISPDGDVWPCVFSRWMTVGNVIEQELADILFGSDAARVRQDLQDRFARDRRTLPCVPKMCDPQCGPSCGPACRPAGNCRPVGGCVPSY